MLLICLLNKQDSFMMKAVEDSLKNLNLFNGGVADKRAGQYSGGMKRRLSVAISLIGNPIVSASSSFTYRFNQAKLLVNLIFTAN